MAGNLLLDVALNQDGSINVNDLITEVGYFPAPQDALEGAADNIKAAAGW